MTPFRVGTAGWVIPKQHAHAFPAAGTHLERYAARLSAVEINSSFYRPHKPDTYARWAASVPPAFRFAVKLPREVTHQRKLISATEPLERFLGEIAALGDKLGPVLVQLPPSLRYDDAVVRSFLDELRARFGGELVCEPRHASWFADGVDTVLSAYRVGRVAADPAPVPRAASPGGWPGIEYRRLHGSPDMYYSSYSEDVLQETAGAMRGAAGSWCIFDNTARGEATANALELLRRLQPARESD